MDYELYHYGIKGMKWGVRKKSAYKSTGIRSAFARRSNENVDRAFKDWNDNVKKRDNAIDLGKKAIAAKRAYESNRSNKELKSEYRQANKDYKKALRSNTTYRKGVVRQEVGRDSARKYLSEAKKVKKQLDADPQNKALQKQYNSLMSKHDIERAKARRATAVSSKRSQAKANIKRSLTKSVKVAVGTAATTAGLYAVNRYLTSHNVTLNGKRINFGAQNVADVVNVAKKVKNAMGFVF